MPEDASIQVRQARREMRYITNPPCMSIPNALGPRDTRQKQHLSPHEPPSWIHLSPCTSYRVHMYRYVQVHTEYIQMPGTSFKGIVRASWFDICMHGLHTESGVRQKYWLPARYLPISKDSDATQITVQNFYFIFQTYRVRNTSYIMHDFSYFFLSEEDPVQQGDEYFSSTPGFYISMFFSEGKSSARKDIRRQLAIFLFIYLFDLIFYNWYIQLIPVGCAICQLDLYMYSHHNSQPDCQSACAKQPQNRANPQYFSIGTCLGNANK